MQPSYSINDALVLLGQCMIELAWLRGRVAQLEAQLAEKSSNGIVDEAEVPSAYSG